MIRKIHAYLVQEVNLAKNAEEKNALTGLTACTGVKWKSMDLIK